MTTSQDTIKVLMVEDNPGDARLIEILLAEVAPAAFSITTRSTLREALTTAKAEAFDIILLDLALPDSRGLDTLSRVTTEVPDRPIIVLSGLDDFNTAMTAVKTGAQDYIVKGKGDGDLIRRAIMNGIERHRVRGQLQVAETVFRNSDTGMLVTDARGIVLRANPAFLEITGYDEEDVVGEMAEVFSSDYGDPGFQATLRKALEETSTWEGELWSRRKDGRLQPDWLRVNAVRGDDGRWVSTVVTFSDVTFRRRVEEDLVRQATTDPLTGLSNRALVEKVLTGSIQRARRYDRPMGLLFVDLDGFKDINDRFGHDAGDDLLREVALRLRRCVRASDEVGRLGGDEFVVILSEIHDLADAETVAIKVVATLAEPISLDPGPAQVSASVGLAVCPLHGQDGAELLHAADEAMYRAKREGRNRHAIASPANRDGK